MVAKDQSSAKPRFRVCTGHDLRIIKGEDAVMVKPLTDAYPESWAFAVCDGHAGVTAANWVVDNLLRHLKPRLPPALPNFGDKGELSEFCSALQVALMEALVAVDNSWLSIGHFSGTTVTAVLVTGPLITCANLGDSTAVLDTGASLLELSHSHRLQTNKSERERLKKAGNTVAAYAFHLKGPAGPNEEGVGPVRVWPGGLCVSRSVGDGDVGPAVVPIPHVRQVLVPAHGCRVIIASDGLWDVVSTSAAARLARSLVAGDAAKALTKAAAHDRAKVIDDTSVIIVDVLPAAGKADSWPAVVASLAHPGADAKAKAKTGAGKKLLKMFMPQRAEADEPDAREVDSGPGKLTFLQDIDCLYKHPKIAAELARNQYVQKDRRPDPPKDSPMLRNNINVRTSVRGPPRYVRPTSGSGGAALIPTRVSLNGALPAERATAPAAAAAAALGVSPVDSPISALSSHRAVSAGVSGRSGGGDGSAHGGLRTPTHVIAVSEERVSAASSAAPSREGSVRAGRTSSTGGGAAGVAGAAGAGKGLRRAVSLRDAQDASTHGGKAGGGGGGGDVRLPAIHSGRMDLSTRLLPMPPPTEGGALAGGGDRSSGGRKIAHSSSGGNGVARPNAA